MVENYRPGNILQEDRVVLECKRTTLEIQTMRTIGLALGAALALILSGCHDQNVKQEPAPVASAAVGAEMCVTNAGSCPIFGTQESGSNCWCNHGYYVRTGYAQ